MDLRNYKNNLVVLFKAAPFRIYHSRSSASIQSYAWYPLLSRQPSLHLRNICIVIFLVSSSNISTIPSLQIPKPFQLCTSNFVSKPINLYCPYDVLFAGPFYSLPTKTLTSLALPPSAPPTVFVPMPQSPNHISLQVSTKSCKQLRFKYLNLSPSPLLTALLLHPFPS